MSGVNEIRSAFTGYFARHGHEVVASSSLVPRTDPTLMFTNAGMVQFKNVFTGVEKLLVNAEPGEDDGEEPDADGVLPDEATKKAPKARRS